jgi:hypothetical protein
MPPKIQRPDRNSTYSFSYAELEAILADTKKIAPIIPLKDYPKNKGRCIILRQDIDLDVYPSYDAYRIQKKLGIKSSFYVLTTSETYNPRSPRIRRMLREMAEDGFEIGLHFDPMVYGRASRKVMQSKVDFEAGIIEEITGEPVLSIALHNPSLLGEYPKFDGYINAYDREIFSDENYISDSMKVDPLVHPYRGKDPLKFLKSVKRFPVQFVLHPEQFLGGGGDYVDTITRHTSREASRIMREYLDTLTTIRRDKLYLIK